MALSAYLTVSGKKQGIFKGSVMEKGREGTVLVHAYSHDVAIPLDATSGTPRGFRQHKPLILTKELDRSSPMFLQALCTNELLTQVTLQLWGTNPGVGMDRIVYTIALTNASIIAIHEYMPDNQDPSQAGLSAREQISFTYQKIQWMWADGGVMAADDWSSPGA